MRGTAGGREVRAPRKTASSLRAIRFPETVDKALRGAEYLYRRADRAPNQTAKYPNNTLPSTLARPIQNAPSRTAE